MINDLLVSNVFGVNPALAEVARWLLLSRSTYRYQYLRATDLSNLFVHQEALSTRCQRQGQGVKANACDVMLVGNRLVAGVERVEGYNNFRWE
jgi:hypothetical protein